MERTEEQAAHKSLVLIVAKRLAIFLFAVSFASLLFWAVGNFRRFLDETELMLLGVLKLSSASLLPLSALGIGLTAVLKGGRRPAQRLAALGGYLFLLLFSAACAFLSELLGLLARGIA